ncbi:hypothetical protein HNQ77_003654 [Silvibacterium bohemicum]|uniref:Right handed beta helix domain-containing protein n=1 Tax=Silvibacterium bohemicum TaxID=1577686 RepID=A0A841JWB3_9BACT|nr:glycosyl hydrolase family 28 protein [Silvibacterium bohemicum]MBB6145693.1 hypothetical protein [Silvibacterium bohemicum]
MAKIRNRGAISIDRRRFLQGAGLLAAGSAFGGSLVGCGSQLNIPCLGPAAAPVPVPGMTYIRASEIGCALDCKLEDGSNKHHGGAATDDGPRINAAMAAATADNPITLIIDGSALISGLFLPAGGHWSIAGLGCGTGFFIKTGTNNDGIHNGAPNVAVPSDMGPPAPPRGMNVSLSNFTLNGNQGNGRNGDSTSGLNLGITNSVYYFGINLMNLDNIVIENIVMVNSPAYNFRFTNVGNVAVSGCVLWSFGLGTDGLHFDGPANDITISNCKFMTGDDSIALNCPEGYSGNISRVTVTNCTFNSWSLMRLYTVDPVGRFTIDTVTVTNCNGTLTEGGFFIGQNNGSLPNSIASLTISDCNLTAPAVLAMGENFGVITVNNVTFTPSRAGIIWFIQQANETFGFLRPSPMNGNQTWVGSNLTLNNCKILRKSGADVSAIILENNSTIENLTFNGFSVEDSGSYPQASELLNIGSQSIGQLVLAALDSSNIKAPVAAGGFSKIGSVAGAGVLATGWEFPDAVMANEVPYISATTDSPSIKVNGVVEPYVQK